eukprot:scaffold1205_cov168-Ochromonas_danica.AAC.7
MDNSYNDKSSSLRDIHFDDVHPLGVVVIVVDNLDKLPTPPPPPAPAAAPPLLLLLLPLNSYFQDD